MPKAKSNPGQRTRLIAAIREHKLLYDPTHPSYNDSEMRHKVWGEVAAQCGIKGVSNAKTMWKQIRDGYRIYLKKPDENHTSYMFYQLMKFIDPHVIHRKPRGKPSVRVLLAKTNGIETEANSNEDLKNAESFEPGENTTQLRQRRSSNRTMSVPSQSEHDDRTEPISNNNEAITKSNKDLNANQSFEPEANSTTSEYTTIQYWDDTDNISDTAHIPTKLATEIPVPMTEDIPPGKIFEAIPQNFNELGKQNTAIIPTSEVDTPQDSHSDSEMESYEDILPAALNNGTADTSLKMFFDAMYASASQLSPNLQRLVKKNIFSTILEAEERFDHEQKLAAAEAQANHVIVKQEH